MTGEQASKVSFWCQECRNDFDLLAHKIPWTWNGSHEYYWMSKCPDCSKKLTRFASEMAKNDPYYVRSTLRRQERYQMATDLLQPGQRGFSRHFPEAEKKRQEVEERNYLEKKQKKVSMEKKYKNLLKTAGITRTGEKIDAKTKKWKEMYLNGL